jgi:thymidylate kinase
MHNTIINFTFLLPPKDSSPELIIRYLVKNQVPLIGLEKYFPEHFATIKDDPEFLAQLDKEKRRNRNWEDNFSRLHDELAKSGIKIVCIKSANLTPSFPYTCGNIDALIHPKYLSQTRELLFASGYVELVNIEEPKKFLFKKFIGEEAVCELHLHTQIGWGVTFIDLEVWENGLYYADDSQCVLLLSNEDQFLVHLAHCFYENKRLKLYDVMRLSKALSEIRNWDYLVEISEKYGWYPGFEYMLKRYSHILIQTNPDAEQNRYLQPFSSNADAEIALPDKMSFLEGKKYYYKKIFSDATTSFSKKIHETISTLLWGIELKLNIKSQSSFFIALSGLDGSGKTTQTEMLLNVFGQTDIKTKYIWKRMNDSLFTRAFNTFGRMLTGKKKAHSESTGGKKSTGNAGKDIIRKNALIGLIWKWVIFLELVSYYNFKLRWLFFSRKVVICDRYIDDAIVELSVMYGRDFSKTFFARLLRSLSPKPDLQLFVDVPIEEIFRRNSDIEEGREFLENSRIYFDSVHNESNIKIINGSRSKENISTEISNIVLRAYYRRYSPLGKKLLLASTKQMNP